MLSILQFCRINVTNYAGDLIDESNYMNNTESFKLVYDSCSEIQINNETYINNTGYIDFGTYNITSPDLNESIIVKINEVPENQRNYYKLVMHNGISSILISTLDSIHNHPNVTTRFHILRDFVIDFKKTEKLSSKL